MGTMFESRFPRRFRGSLFPPVKNRIPRVCAEEPPNDPGSIGGSFDVIARLLLIARCPDTGGERHPQKDYEERIRPWKDKSARMYKSRSCPDNRSGSPPQRPPLFITVAAANCFFSELLVSARNLLFSFTKWSDLTYTPTKKYRM